MATTGELLRAILENDPERAQSYLKTADPFEVRSAYKSELTDFIEGNYNSGATEANPQEWGHAKIKEFFPGARVPLTNNIRYVKESPTGQDTLSQQGANGTWRPSDRLIRARPPGIDSLSTRLHELGHDNDFINKDFEALHYGYDGATYDKNPIKISDRKIVLPEKFQQSSQGIRFEQDMLNESPKGHNQLMKDFRSGGVSEELARNALGYKDVNKYDRMMTRAGYATGEPMAEKFWDGHHASGLFEKEALKDLATRGFIREASMLGLQAVPIAVEGIEEYFPGITRSALNKTKNFFMDSTSGDSDVVPDKFEPKPPNPTYEQKRVMKDDSFI
jgi:hypothetical protein